MGDRIIHTEQGKTPETQKLLKVDLFKSLLEGQPKELGIFDLISEQFAKSQDEEKQQ